MEGNRQSGHPTFCLLHKDGFSSHARLFFVSGVALMFSQLVVTQQTSCVCDAPPQMKKNSDHAVTVQ